MSSHPFLLAVAVLVLVRPYLGQAQDMGDEVDDLTLTEVSAKVVKLQWTGPTSVECESSITYSVFRGTSEDFTPSLKNRIATGLNRTTYLASVPLASKDYYYYVRTNIVPAPCTLRSGEISVYPLDLGQNFPVTISGRTSICTARSTAEINCPAPLSDFHAVIARQVGHEYLIGCQSVDYEAGDWTCANLTPGIYHIGVHSQTLTVWDSGLVKVNTRTGKKLASITPIFSVLARIK